MARESKKIFTSGDVAKMLGVTRITVNRWVDSGKIRGYTLPNSGDRRITLENLLEFVKLYNLPIELLRTADEDTRAPRGVYIRVGDRKAVQFKARIVVHLQDGASFDTGEGSVRDLNGGGAFLAGLRLKQGTIPASPFYLEIEIQEGPLKGLRANGLPIRMSVGQESVGFGIRFFDLDEASSGRIKAFVSAS